jgi:ubiquinone/menaquinone biosynthesis C-methylase UbiE
MEMNRQLGKEQYVNSDKFNARIYLNTKFRTNQYPWPAWVFDQFEKHENYKIFELGCGNGLLWKINAKRIPNTWEITLSDYSEGMLNDAQKNLADIRLNLNYMVTNAEDINQLDKSFDLVIANNMLYHVSNRKKALSDIRRVLKNDGVFYATTASINNMHELRTLVKPFIDNPMPTVVSNFSLENGKDQLEDYFPNIEMRKYNDSLGITEADAIVNYFLSFNEMTEGNVILKQEQVEEFRQYITEKLDVQGKISVTKDTGIFICRK